MESATRSQSLCEKSFPRDRQSPDWRGGGQSPLRVELKTAAENRKRAFCLSLYGEAKMILS
jgi:hypothetical protein